MSLTTYLLAVIFTLAIAAFLGLFFINPVVKSEYSKRMQTDISVCEMRQLEHKLSQFLAENNLKPGVSIWKVAESLNVQDAGGVDNIEARAQIFDVGCNNKIVVHNNKIPPNKWLFDFAHELGHQINGDPIPANRPLGYNKPRIDQLADYTAAALLMPFEQVNKYLLHNGYELASTRKRIILIKRLSKKYNVSETLAIRRVNEIRMQNKK